MIRSVGVGGSNVSNQQKRAQKAPETPFPKLGKTSEEEVGTSEQKPLMVGVKMAPHVRSILEEETNYMRLNADGDRLDVSKKAIQLAKDRFAI